MRPFLPERFETIFKQTMDDFEVLVYDSYSDDGAWEYIQELAAREPKIKAWQGPRAGTPGSWNPCVQAARGKYVYIATSDDTMPPNCLERLAAALDANPDCDLAHCRIKVIDEKGKEGPDWWKGCVFARSCGELLTEQHVRLAPFDGLLHLSGDQVYVSITQMLIRRSLFEKVGMFEKQWGSQSDYNWHMRATLVANTVHVPDTWGGWRVHSAQATGAVDMDSVDRLRKVDAMIENAVAFSEARLDERVRRALPDWASRAKECRQLAWEIRHSKGLVKRRLSLISKVLSGSAAARSDMKAWLKGELRWPESAPEIIQSWLNDVGLSPRILRSSDSRR